MTLEDFFSKITLARARAIVSHGLVKIEEFAHAEDIDSLDYVYVTGSVKGTARTPYDTEAHIDDDGIASYCSCPVDEQCKHGAALVMTWLATQSNPGSLDSKLNIDKNHDPHLYQMAEAVGHDTQVMSWVSELVEALQPKTVSLPAVEQQTPTHIIYVVVAADDSIAGSGGSLGVQVLVSESDPVETDIFAIRQHYPLYDHFSLHTAIGDEADQSILDLLLVNTQRSRKAEIWYDDAGVVLLSGGSGALLLQQMLKTGRLYWHEDGDAPLRAGGEIQADLKWLNVNDSIQFSTSLHDEGPVYLADTQPVWYVNPVRNIAGTVRSAHTAAMLASATHAPALPVSAAQALSNLIVSNQRDAALPLPAKPSVVFVNKPLNCRLRLYSKDGTAQVGQWTVAVLMCYERHVFHVELQPKSHVSVVTLDDGTAVEISRDHDQEYRMYQFFRRRVSGFEPAYSRDPARYSISDHQPLARNDNDRFRSFERLFDAFDSLKSEGFEIIVEPPVTLETETVTDFDFDLQATDNGWFDLGLQLTHEGTSYKLLPLILTWLAKGDRHTALTVVAADGKRLSVPAELLKPVADTLLELYDESTDKVVVSRARALGVSRLSKELSELGGSGEWHGDTALLALAEKMQRINSNPEQLLKNAKAPRTLKAELRPYQLTGMAWLNFLHDAQLCGVLADDMGLGKTIQTLAHILSLKQRRKLQGPALVVAPTSVLHNWAREGQRFAPSLKTRVWHGTDRHQQPLADSDALLVVTSYSLALRDQGLLAEHGFALLVLDEAQVIKNPAAKITQALKAMPISQRICLTGTPLENHLGELWSLFDFLMPGILGSQKRFSQYFRTPIEKHGDNERQQRLNNAIAPYLLRRRKHAVASELPAKTTVVRKIKLEADQARLYESIRVGMEKRVRQLLQERGVARSHIQMLDALLKLRQSCCHPQLVKLPSARKVKNSAKTDYVLGMLSELVAEGRKIILFSQFTTMLDILERDVKKLGISYVKLTGKTRKRDVAIDAFQQGDVPLFLISLKAGGTGLNLTAADTVIHYDPWWNPAVENQATDRAHRIGQDKPVFVYKLIAEDTVEDKIVAMQSRKQALADATVEGGDANQVRSLSSEDILSLFAED